MAWKLFYLLVSFLAVADGATLRLSWARNLGNQGTKTIDIGDSVTWSWTDPATHTVDTDSSALSGFGSGTKSGTSSTYTYTFTVSGSFEIHCSIHNNMKVTIDVEDTSPTPRPTTLAPSTARPTAAANDPTFPPTISPTIDLSPYTSNLVSDFLPAVLSSGSDEPSSWSLTLHVRAHRHESNAVSFNTRSYCYQETICSYPGPTISLLPGDNLTLTLINELGPQPNNKHIHNTMHSTNSTNIHTHGLHISPFIDSIFVKAEPGENLTYHYEIFDTHAPGLHWYHAHLHGSSTLQLMGGLAGALIVAPLNSGADNVPISITAADSFLIVVTHMVFKQEVDISSSSDGSEVVTQGCGVGFACDPLTQSPLCTGDEETSPFNAFRLYSYPELSAAVGSDLPIDVQFTANNTTTTTTTVEENFLLVNGRYQPTVELLQNSPVILRVLHAAGGQPLPLKTSADASCSIAVIAWDGVYLNARLEQEQVNMVAASRVEIEVNCSTAGVFSINSGNTVLLYLLVTATAAGGEVGSSSDIKAAVTDEELAAIVRPWYLQDLTGDDILANSTYSVTIDQAFRNHSVCGYVLGAGSNCSSSSIASDSCPYGQFTGQRGSNVGYYLADNKLVTFTGAVNEWTLHGTGTAFHPLHIHVNHFQIISFESLFDASEENYYRVGQWRDTIPPVADQLKFRFVAADFTGETILHCHFQRHEDLGMMDSFLITDPVTYDAVFTDAPTPAPSTVMPTTASPSLTPSTAAPTAVPTTAVPTAAPTTISPTITPTTIAPTTTVPTTAAPTIAPTTAVPTATPTTVSPTITPTTIAPTTAVPTAAPTTVSPTTAAPTVAPTTAVPTTAEPTAVPTTTVPTAVPTTAAPTTATPTAAPAKDDDDENGDVLVGDGDDDQISADNCFAATTTLLLSTGAEKLISAVAVGDSVMVYHPLKQQLSFAEVVFIPHGMQNQLPSMFVEVHTAKRRLQVTPQHLLLAGECNDNSSDNGSDNINSIGSIDSSGSNSSNSDISYSITDSSSGSFELTPARQLSTATCLRTIDGDESITALRWINGFGIYTVITADADSLLVANGVVASSFATNHWLVNLYYNIHRGLYASLLFPNSLLHSNASKALNMMIGNIAVAILEHVAITSTAVAAAAVVVAATATRVTTPTATQRG